VRKTYEKVEFRGARGDRGAIQVTTTSVFLRGFSLLATSFVTLGFITTPASATIQYSVSLEHPEQHLFHVTMTIPNVHESVNVQIPAWNALYQIRDFSSHVREVEAFIEGKIVPAEKFDKQTWRVQGSGTIVIKYSILWDDVGPFASQLNAEHAFINPAMVFFYVPDRRNESVSLEIGGITEGWRVESSLLGSTSSERQDRAVSLEAPTYDALADSPIELGKFEEFDLPGISPRISVAVHGDNWIKEKLKSELKRICEYELKLMGGAPFERYVFILHIGKGAGGGGMEHANSTAIGVPSDEFLQGVAAHEFFHLWNVKRIRPASLEPVDYSKEQYTRGLWFAEGVTSTYGSLTLVRSGLWKKEQFYSDLGEQITELESRPANHWQSAEQSSLDAWLEKYQIYNQPENSVSYYTKGQVLGDLLDIQIRGLTSNAKSLDDVLRTLNANFAKQGKWYNDSLDIRLTAEKLAGASFEDFFRRYVAGTDPFPYRETLALAGLDLRTVERLRASLGFYAERDSSGNLVVREIDPAGPAARAGLQVDDVILKWNGSDPPRRISSWMRAQKPGDKLKLQIRRDSKESNIEFQLGEQRIPAYEVSEVSNPSEKARRIREGILQGTTNSPASN
jgi:predicted metalloprotease with PDZ domain